MWYNLRIESYTDTNNDKRPWQDAQHKPLLAERWQESA